METFNIKYYDIQYATDRTKNIRIFFTNLEVVSNKMPCSFPDFKWWENREPIPKPKKACFNTHFGTSLLAAAVFVLSFFGTT